MTHILFKTGELCSHLHTCFSSNKWTWGVGLEGGINVILNIVASHVKGCLMENLDQGLFWKLPYIFEHFTTAKVDFNCSTLWYNIFHTKTRSVFGVGIPRVHEIDCRISKRNNTNAHTRTYASSLQNVYSLHGSQALTHMDVHK